MEKIHLILVEFIKSRESDIKEKVQLMEKSLISIYLTLLLFREDIPWFLMDYPSIWQHPDKSGTAHYITMWNLLY